MADIPINEVTRRVQFTGNTTTGPFAFTFNILSDDDIIVYKNFVLQTITTHYTVSTNANGTGSITLTSPLVASDVLTIIGGRALERTTDFVTAGDLLASSLNEQLDSQVIMSQQLDEKLDRALKVDIGDQFTDLSLPSKANRLGTVLAFNATSGDPEAGPQIADVSTLAAITADIATLADIEDGTDATDAIQTVAGISSNVSTVAGISGNVTTVAGISSNVTTVAGISANTTTVAGISSDVTTVAGISANVTTVANDGTDIGTVASNISNVNTVASVSSNVTTVAGISSDVTSVANDATDIGAVAAIASNVTTVAGIDSNITTVAGISSNVTTVAGISANVTTVAGDTTNIGTIATNLGGTDTIGTVAGSISNVNSVGGSISNVNTVATNINNINDFSDIYRVGTSDPSSNNDSGDLFYNTQSGILKVYNGNTSSWEQGVTAGSGFLQLSGGTLTGALTLSGAPTQNLHATTKQYVDTEVAGIVDSAPSTLNTLNELAAALGDDANFSTTVTNSIAAKLPLAGGTMSGAIAMGTNKITGLGDPTAAQDSATKNYVDTQLASSGVSFTTILAFT